MPHDIYYSDISILYYFNLKGYGMLCYIAIIYCINCSGVKKINTDNIIHMTSGQMYSISPNYILHNEHLYIFFELLWPSGYEL